MESVWLGLVMETYSWWITAPLDAMTRSSCVPGEAERNSKLPSRLTWTVSDNAEPSTNSTLKLPTLTADETISPRTVMPFASGRCAQAADSASTAMAAQRKYSFMGPPLSGPPSWWQPLSVGMNRGNRRFTSWGVADSNPRYNILVRRISTFIGIQNDSSKYPAKAVTRAWHAIAAIRQQLEAP